MYMRPGAIWSMEMMPAAKGGNGASSTAAAGAQH